MFLGDATYSPVPRSATSTDDQSITDWTTQRWSASECQIIVRSVGHTMFWQVLISGSTLRRSEPRRKRGCLHFRDLPACLMASQKDAPSRYVVMNLQKD